MYLKIGCYVLGFKGKNNRDWFTLIKEQYDERGEVSFAHVIFKI